MKVSALVSIEVDNFGECVPGDVCDINNLPDQVKEICEKNNMEIHSLYLPIPVKEQWKEFIENKDLKYFVLKADDWFASLSEEELFFFDMMLEKMENYRLTQNKKRTNSYWVVNRDETFAPAVKMLIESSIGKKLKE